MKFGYVWLLCMSVTSLCYGAAAQDPFTSPFETIRVYRAKAKKGPDGSDSTQLTFLIERTVLVSDTEDMVKGSSDGFELWCYKEGVKCTCTERYTECTCFDHEQHYFAPDLPERWVKTGEIEWFPGDTSPPTERMVKQPAPLLDRIKHARQTYPLVIAVCIGSKPYYGTANRLDGWENWY